MTKKIKSEISGLITETTIEALQDIDRLHACKDAGDAGGAIKSGAVLLAISRVDNDKDGDGFRYLIGLHRDTKLNSHLSLFFQ